MRTSLRSLAAVATLGALAAAAGCGTAAAGTWQGPGDPGASPGAKAAITAPVDGATGAATSSEISFTSTDATSTSVTLVDSSGAAVEGSMRADGSAWVPATQLKYATTYTATVTAGTGQPDTRKVTFTTMDRPKNLVRVSTPVQDNAVYGVGMPIVVRFDKEVSKEERANVQRRLFVTSEPAQEGRWNWFSGTEVHFRPKEYWQEGTKLSVRLATGGLALGRGGYGAKDVTISATIGDKIVMSIDDATKRLTVSRHDQVIKTIPVSLGKASTPSSSGQMVVMTKNQSDLFVSTDPRDPYRETVYWTQRLTDGGEYLHAAPWSVGAQGRHNVSHGCTNMSTANAKWLYGITHIGDPVIVAGTDRKLEWGNGWTDWNRPWDQYVPGSAQP